jgi:hypothetical protein
MPRLLQSLTSPFDLSLEDSFNMFGPVAANPHDPADPEHVHDAAAQPIRRTPARL